MPLRLADRWREERTLRGIYGSLGSYLTDWRWRLARRTRSFGYGRTVEVNVRGLDRPIYIRLGSSDRAVLVEVFARNEYDRKRLAAFDEVRTILDLGANTGITIRYWRSVFPDARIVAVEPDAGNFRLLEQNIVGLAGVTAVQTFVGAAEGQAYLEADHESFALRMSHRPAGEPIACTTVPRLLERFEGLDIDLLKCDIEGSEAELFADCAAWIGRVRRVVVEVHSPYNVSRLLEDLARNGGRFQLMHCDDKAEFSVAWLARVED
jgi:FkbM family methyltransferase